MPERTDPLKYKIIRTSAFLMDGKCVGCKTVITRHNSELGDDGIRTCKVCGISQVNGWRVPL
jgi:hypothetical protein